MQAFQAESDVTVSIPLTDLSGTNVVATALSWRLLDNLNTEILPWANIAVPVGNSVSITVPAISNQLSAGFPTAARTIELSITTVSENILKASSYLLKSRQRLILLVNSFQNLTQAEVEASTIFDLDAWETAIDDNKTLALIQAFRRLTLFGYFVQRSENSQTIISWNSGAGEYIKPSRWKTMTEDTYLTAYPETFRAALRRAQVIEANSILKKDPLAYRRRSGVIEDEVGESRMKFSDIKPLDLGVSRRTLEELSGYIVVRQTISRS
jgi:hypothetical protein